jgi:hypothetical protein
MIGFADSGHTARRNYTPPTAVLLEEAEGRCMEVKVTTILPSTWSSPPLHRDRVPRPVSGIR